MRKIIISSDYTPSIEVFDESDVDFDQYCKDLSKIFKENNITILKTTSSTTILRPSKIVGIKVMEVEELLDEYPSPPDPPPKRIKSEDVKLLKKENKNKKSEEDTITDVN